MLLRILLSVLITFDLFSQLLKKKNICTFSTEYKNNKTESCSLTLCWHLFIVFTLNCHSNISCFLCVLIKLNDHVRFLNITIIWGDLPRLFPLIQALKCLMKYCIIGKTECTDALKRLLGLLT